PTSPLSRPAGEAVEPAPPRTDRQRSRRSRRCRTERAPDPTRILARLPRRVPGLSRRIYRRLVKRVALNEQTTSLIIRNGSGGSMPSYKMEVKHLNFPDEVRKFENGKIELVKMGGGTIGRTKFEPGWRWAKRVKTKTKTDRREAPHCQYH